MRKIAQLLIVLLAVMFTNSAAASGPTTGTLSGEITDAAGTPVPEVSLVLSGSLLAAPRATVSNDRGVYRFSFLPPGDDYVLEAVRPGVGSVRRSTIAVRLGREATLDLTLIASTSGEVTVVATPPLIDVREAASSTSITLDQIESFPTRRDFQQLTALAPQVIFDRSPLSPAIAGSTHLENDYTIEGLSTRDPGNASSATNLTMNFVEEVQVLTSGLPTEYGRVLGGLVNVVTRQGTNELTGKVVAYYDDSDWSEDDVTSAYRGTTHHDLGRDKKDVGLSLGGPLRRDRVWFFGAFNPRRDVTPIRLTDALFAIDRRERITREERVYAAKVTASIGPSIYATGAAFGNPTIERGWMGDVRSDPSAALMSNYTGSRDVTARVQASPSPRMTFEINGGLHRQEWYFRPDAEGADGVPFQRDALTNFRHGGMTVTGYTRPRRESLSFRSSHYAGAHELRYGADGEKNLHHSTARDHLFVWFGQTEITPEIGVQDLLIEAAYDDSGHSESTGVSLFAQDRWDLTSRLTLLAGLRWERQSIGSGRGGTVATGTNADGTIARRAIDSFTFGDDWAPRLAVTWDPTGRGRARLFASAGRYIEAIPNRISIEAMNGYAYSERYWYSTTSHTSANWYNPHGSPLNEKWILFDEMTARFNNYGNDRGPVPIAPDAKLPHQDEWTLGADVQFGSAWTVGARIVSRRLGSVLEDHVVLGPKGAVVDELISNPGASTYSANFRRPERTYDAIELSVQRRLWRRWQLMGSVVSARSRGDYDGLYDYANYGASPNLSWLVEYPSLQHNNSGRLRGDRPYMAKLHSSVELPFGISVSESLSFNAGIPISAYAARRLLSGARGMYLRPRGSVGRTPSYWNLDLHAAWRIPVRLLRGSSATVVADVFNATNEHEVLEVDEEYFWHGQPDYRQWIASSNRDEFGNVRFNPNLAASPFYGTPTLYQQPRAVQVGLRVQF